jgi:hypothetical protein
MSWGMPRPQKGTPVFLATVMTVNGGNIFERHIKKEPQIHKRNNFPPLSLTPQPCICKDFSGHPTDRM